MLDAKSTRPVRKEDVERNTIVTAVIPYVLRRSSSAFQKLKVTSEELKDERIGQSI
jgi:hypothetical protein